MILFPWRFSELIFHNLKAPKLDALQYLLQEGRRCTMIPNSPYRVGGITVLILTVITALSLTIFIPFAKAEQPFNLMGCGVAATRTLSDCKALTVYNIAGNGTACGTIGDKEFHELTWEFIIVLRAIGGNAVGRGYYKFTFPDSDYFVLEATGTVLEGSTWDMLHGTGKWAGIRGKGYGRFVIRGKPQPIETEQYWFRIYGMLELPR
jgi:hypothetical protein